MLVFLHQTRQCSHCSIDGIAYEDEVLSSLSSRSSDSEVEFKRDYGKRDVDTDFSGFTGLMKLVDVLSGLKKITKEIIKTDSHHSCSG